MKGRINPKVIVIFVLLYGSFSNNFGQEKIDISTGFGIFELANIGFRYQINQTQIGLSVGTHPWHNDSVWSFLGDVFFHFGSFSELSNRKPWYIRLGLTYLRGKSNNNDGLYQIDSYFYLNIRMGREFNISRKFGIYFDLGFNSEIKHNIKNNYPPPTEPVCCQGGPPEIPFLPAIGLGMFYKL